MHTTAIMTIRPVRADDVTDILALAAKTGSGLTTLPADETLLKARIDRSLRTWRGSADKAEQGYLFVLEDSVQQRVVGVSAIEVAVGLQEPWYNFRVGTLVHASRALNVYNAVPTLYLSNDHTGQSELCTLFLDPDYRQGTNGQLLIKARLMFMAAFRQRFGRRVVAEMRGFSDDAGYSPFWANLGQRFFSIDFAHADHLSISGNKAFIAELMPKHPLYVDLLAAEARDVIGVVHPQTEPAKATLESEGLRYQGYIDIFDGGPTLEAEIDDIRTLRESRVISVASVSSASVKDDETLPWLLLANDDYNDYRVVVAKARVSEAGAELEPRIAQALNLNCGQSARMATLFAREKTV
ncbi:arginine succinyltransferase [Biostraticola tofi]|uniref:Arginine N-succinyltransferase n=1 Tax=Biostraticola tofi TaxID=466109 RepID=A0A4R3Z1S2_9GAMM|nr:arginine succinyltransferase [Biostraticola tofi]